MSKFSKPFAELRLYLPLESDSWEVMQATSLADLITKHGKAKVHNPNKTKKEAHNGKHQA